MKKRYHLIEIHEQPWCPEFIRNSVTDYLQYAITTGDVYRPVLPKLKDAVENARSAKILDLCSGGGGAWVNFRKDFAQTEVILTDLFPNRDAFQQLKTAHDLNYSTASVNVLDVPQNLDGFRTMFSSFHHFPPTQARQILRSAVNKNCGIGIFELTSRNLKTLLVMFLTPLMVLFLTPKIKPFRWSRIIFTYLFPVIPFIVGFDGVVSVLRTYTPEELLEMTDDIKNENYVWEAGMKQGEKSPIPIVYLIGYPEKK